jgi:23S rRNA (guanine745-N1)-methyltransferase
VCRDALLLGESRRVWDCPRGHSFDVAREGYVNLLLAGQRRSRQPGDSSEMISARRRFLATGAYDPLSEALSHLVTALRPDVVLDVGCGEGRHTRAAATSPLVLGIDVAKVAVAIAARAHPKGWYAVASAADLPLGDAKVDAVMSVFGPVVPAELARVLRTDGVVVAIHPGPAHLEDLRAIVYSQARDHEVKPPLRGAAEWFAEKDLVPLRFPLVVTEAALLRDLFAMTPYRWHAPPDVGERLSAAASAGFETTVDVCLTTYRRTGRPCVARPETSAI